MAELKGEMPGLMIGGMYFDAPYNRFPVLSGPSGECDHEIDGSENDETIEINGANDGSGDCTELFKKHLSKKTNIYNVNSSIPLSTPWTFWVDRTQPGMGVEEFEASLRRIKTVYSVHVFWAVFYNIPLPSVLHGRSSLHVTRDDRKPIWEEEYNSKGGSFRLRTQKKDTDKVWRELLMATVGEQFDDFVDPKDEICGISVSIRDREDVVLIWNKDTKFAEKARVFECAHKILPDTHFLSETYKPHDAHHSFKKHKVAGYQNGHAHGHENNHNANGSGHEQGTGGSHGHGSRGNLHYGQGSRGHGRGQGSRGGHGHEQGSRGGHGHEHGSRGGHGHQHEERDGYVHGNLGNGHGHTRADYYIPGTRSAAYAQAQAARGNGQVTRGGRSRGNGPARRISSNDCARALPRSRGDQDYAYELGHGHYISKY